MSLYIDVDRVSAVLLSDGQWYEVAGDSFQIDAYEYHYMESVVFAFGREGCGAPYNGFAFKADQGDYLCGPISSIQAVRTARGLDVDDDTEGDDL